MTRTFLPTTETYRLPCRGCGLAYLTAIPSWKEGDEFPAGSELVKFRILDVDTEQTPGDAHGVFTVEAVEPISRRAQHG